MGCWWISSSNFSMTRKFPFISASWSATVEAAWFTVMLAPRGGDFGRSTFPAPASAVGNGGEPDETELELGTLPPPLLTPLTLPLLQMLVVLYLTVGEGSEDSNDKPKFFLPASWLTHFQYSSAIFEISGSTSEYTVIKPFIRSTLILCTKSSSQIVFFSSTFLISISTMYIKRSRLSCG